MQYTPPPPRKRRSLTIPFPPAWFIAQVLVIGTLVGLVLADRAYWNEFVTHPVRIERLQTQIAELEDDVLVARSARDSQARADISTLDAQVERVATISGVAFAALFQDRQNLGAEATEALAQRCRDWILRGGDGATACR